MIDVWQFTAYGLPLFGSRENRGRTRFFGLGEIRLVILSLIGETPKHGYQLMKELGERLGGLYRSSAGTVYPTLKQLEKEGFIESRLKEGRNVYRLTREGRKIVVEEARSIADIWSRASNFREWGQQLGPHTLVIAGPLQEVITAGLLAATWSSGNSDREDRVRYILREVASKLRGLAEDQNHSREEQI
jgi:DNA-binding PadR family transcriptional regulator